MPACLFQLPAASAAPCGVAHSSLLRRRRLFVWVCSVPPTPAHLACVALCLGGCPHAGSHVPTHVPSACHASVMGPGNSLA
eukprot:363520-Chlamydomonas_euryale.AAC.2